MSTSVVTRRHFLTTSAALGAGALALVGCDAVDMTPTFQGAATNGAVLAFDDAVARPASEESFIDDLTGDKLKFFDRIFFVNKSPWGAYSQTLKILDPDQPGVENTVWRVTRTMDVSTGREMEERYFTTTPRGIFTLDPHRKYRDYQSRQWDGADMPFAMFWDYIYPNGRPTGIAFHAATGMNEHFVGLRASGGCIRTTMADSEELFNMVAAHRGPIPDFLDRDPRALLQYNDDESVKMKDAFKILVVVEDNDHIDWQPFVSDRVWQRRLDNKKVLRNTPSHAQLVAAGQN